MTDPTTHPRLAPLLGGILERPDCDVRRLAYADALEEFGDNGDRFRAEFIRVQVELAGMPPEPPVVDVRDATMSAFGQSRDCFEALAAEPEAALPRSGDVVMVRCGHLLFRRCVVGGVVSQGYRPSLGEGGFGMAARPALLRFRALPATPEDDRREQLRRRERELLFLQDESGKRVAYRWAAAMPLPFESLSFRRGFIEKVTCTAADCLLHLDAARKAQPVTHVTLTTWEGNDRDVAIRRWAEKNPSLDGPGRRTWRQVLGGEHGLWPGVDFTLPNEMVGINGLLGDIANQLRANLGVPVHVQTGTDANYASLHETGSRRRPRRPFLGDNP